MAARRDEFLDLYVHYRLRSSLDRSGNQSRREDARRKWLIASVPVLSGGAAVAETLTAIGVGALVGPWVALSCVVAALAVVTGVVVSAGPVRAVSSARANKDRDLTSLLANAPPGSAAIDPEITAWVGRVEAVLTGAVPGESQPEGR